MLCGPSPSPLPSSEGSRHARHVTCKDNWMRREGGGESQGRSKRQGPETAGIGQPEGELKAGGRGRARESFHGVRSCPVPRTADQNPSTALAQLVT